VTDASSENSEALAGGGKFLIFGVHGSLYGVDARAVQEILALPELTPLVEAPVYVAGILDVRGRVAPVIDLSQRLGLGPQPLRLSDCVILFESAAGPLHDSAGLWGLLVERVIDLRSMAAEQVEPLPDLAPMLPAGGRFAIGVARSGEELVTLLDPQRLFTLPGEVLDVTPGEPGAAAWGADAPPPEREVFRERAAALRRPPQADPGAQITLAVVRLDDEYFGMDLDLVVEFAGERALTPVPCCPPHVLGCVNLRGEVLPILDIRAMLSLTGSTNALQGNLMVVRVDALRVGLAVDEACDVLSLPAHAVQPAPLAVQALRQDYARGAVDWNGRVVTLLDLRNMLGQDGLQVDETV